MCCLFVKLHVMARVSAAVAPCRTAGWSHVWTPPTLPVAGTNWVPTTQGEVQLPPHTRCWASEALPVANPSTASSW